MDLCSYIAGYGDAQSQSPNDKLCRRPRPVGAGRPAPAADYYYPQENPQPSRDPQQKQNGGGESRPDERRHPLGSAASGSAGMTFMNRSERARAREACAMAQPAYRGDTRARVWGWGGGVQPARTPHPPPVRPVGLRRTCRRYLPWATSSPPIWACAAAVHRVRRSHAAAQRERRVSSRARAPGRSGAAHDLVCLPHEVRTVRGGVRRGGAPHRGRAGWQAIPIGIGCVRPKIRRANRRDPRSRRGPVRMLRAAFSRASRAAPTPALRAMRTAGLLSSAAPTPALCAVQLMPKEARRSELNAWLREGRQLLENTLRARRPKSEVHLRCPVLLVRSPATATITTRCRRVCSLARIYSHATTGSTSQRPPKSSPTRSRSSSPASTTCTCGGRQRSGARGPTNP